MGRNPDRTYKDPEYRAQVKARKGGRSVNQYAADKAREKLERVGEMYAEAQGIVQEAQEAAQEAVQEARAEAARIIATAKEEAQDEALEAREKELERRERSVSHAEEVDAPAPRPHHGRILLAHPHHQGRVHQIPAILPVLAQSVPYHMEMLYPFITVYRLHFDILLTEQARLYLTHYVPAVPDKLLVFLPCPAGRDLLGRMENHRPRMAHCGFSRFGEDMDMGWKCLPQVTGLVRGEPKPGAKHRSNGAAICGEAGKERHSASETLDRTRSKYNQYAGHVTGRECCGKHFHPISISSPKRLKPQWAIRGPFNGRFEITQCN